MDLTTNAADYSHRWWRDVLRQAVQAPPWTWGERVRAVLTPRPLPGDKDLEKLPRDAWPIDRRVPAEAIRSTLLDPWLQHDPHGLVLRGLFVTGQLDLSGATLPCPLILTHSCFEEALLLRGATIPSLDLSHGAAPGLILDTASVDGQLRLVHTVLRHEAGHAFEATERISIDDALLQLPTTRPDGAVLSLAHATVHGNACLNGLRTRGTVWAPAAFIGGQLQLKAATLDAAEKSVALNLQHITISSGALLPRLRTTGAVWAPAASIGGQLQLDHGAKLVATKDRAAFTMQHSRISGGVYLEGLRTVGAVHALSATIGGHLDLSGAVLTTAHSTALNLRNTEIGGGVALTGATLDQCHGCGDEWHRKPPPERMVLDLRHSAVRSSVRLAGTTTSGTIDAMGARFAGGVHLDTTRMTGSETAVRLNHSSIERLWLSDCSSNVRSIDLAHTDIDTLRVDNLSSHTQLPSLQDAQGWSVTSINGFLGRDEKQVAAWLDGLDPPSADEGSTRPAQDTGARPSPPDSRRSSRPASWRRNRRLRSHYSRSTRHFSAQPWKEVARVYDATGHHTGARWLRKEAAKRTTWATPTAFRRTARRVFYGGTVRYGYQPWLTLVWILGLYLLSLFITFQSADRFVPLDAPEDLPAGISLDVHDSIWQPAFCVPPGPHRDAQDLHPPFNSCLYTVDMTLPIAETGQSEHWTSGNPWISGFFGLVKTATWALTALLLAGITGILRKD